MTEPFPAGTRVKKINSEPGDAHQDGALASVRRAAMIKSLLVGYFVSWDDLPPWIPVFISTHRLAPMEDGKPQ